MQRSSHKPDGEQLLLAFSFGFLIDLSGEAIVKPLALIEWGGLDK